MDRLHGIRSPSPSGQVGFPPSGAQTSDSFADSHRPLIQPAYSAEDRPRAAGEPRHAIPMSSMSFSAAAPPRHGAASAPAHELGSSDASYNPLPNAGRTSVESPGWDYTSGRAESKSGISYKESLLVHPEKQPWTTSLRGWVPELLWCVVSTASVAALAGVLSRFDGQPLPEWPLGLTLNTLIAFLATLARAAFVIPVSESISQLKWLWYREERPLKDFQDFDSASRRPWGSIQLLKTTRACVILTVVLITAIFTSTLTQSAVTYPVRLARVDGTAVVSRSTSFYFNTANVFSGVTQQHYTEQSIFEGLSYSHTQEFPLSPARCPTSECRWQPYTSLSVCAKFWNVTDSLNVTVAQRSPPPPLCFASLPNGISANLSGYYQGMVVLRGTRRPIASDVNPESAIFNFTVLYSLRTGPVETVGAAEAVLYFCTKTYDLSFAGNIEARSVADGRRELPAIRDPLEPGANFPFGGTGLGSIVESLAYALNGTYADMGASDPSTLALAPARYWAALQYGAKTLEDQGRPDIPQEIVVNEAIANITGNVARSLSNRIAKDTTNVTGDALAAETFVQVRWPWLAFISSQVALSALLLATAIVQTRAARIGVVKSSVLQGLVAVNSRDKQGLEICLAHRRHQDEVDEIVRRGPGIAWSLGMTERGWKLGG
ncbi:hypothetical protein CTA2_5291 [Colletotrichum tanaceti]|uniref:Uncharacterized protein n=1 Tax=Colletotrichum tanaceti TaxID=1306861 RepID=A0A4U6XHL3_9PEZI|nr:hypothetical protein CTA2_5291 [Colletotrichum tanaceti]TKW54919.1 hypothetical protein CTA1_500 [Colletotrichum tanaceti]